MSEAGLSGWLPNGSFPGWR